jgi:hypothetical protein
MARKYLTQTGAGPRVLTETEVIEQLGVLTPHSREEQLERYGVQDEAEQQRLLALVRWAAARHKLARPREREAF